MSQLDRPAHHRPRLSTLTESIDAFLRESGLQSNQRGKRELDAWKRVAENEDVTLARRSRPVGFRRGELTVEVDSAALMSELAGFRGQDLRRAANGVLGRETIRRVSFKLKR